MDALISANRVIVGAGGQQLEDGAVLVQNEVITDTGDRAGVESRAPHDVSHYTPSRRAPCCRGSSTAMCTWRSTPERTRSPLCAT